MILEQVERFLGDHLEVVSEAADELQKIEPKCTYSRVSGDVDVILVYKWSVRSWIRKLGGGIEVEYGKFTMVCPLAGVSGMSEVTVHVVVFPDLD